MPKNLLRYDDFNVAEVERGYGTEAFLAPEGEYETVLDTDAMRFGGFGNIDDKVRHFTAPDPLYHPAAKGWLRLYLPARTAQVLRMVPWNGGIPAPASGTGGASTVR